jgi:NAD(P)-dependent dehydrogenase (short-subunit alcohol dehydrogenase family)
MRTVLLTNATQYAGPGVLDTLLAQGARVICHDASFADPQQREGFERARVGVTGLSSQEPSGMAAELQAGGIALDAVVFNDVYPLTPKPIGEIDLADFRNTFEAVFMFPVDLAQRLLPAMKARGTGSLVFVTSARQLRAERGFAVPTSIRSATSTFALALAREVANSGVQVNVVAPNYLYSEMYYPRARFVDDPQGRQAIAEVVPMGRLGTPEEIGELVAFLASGRCGFVTGQVIYFTGGWP